MNERKRLLEILREKSFERREVTLSAGGKSDFYIDGKQTTLDAEGAYLVGRLIYEIIKESSTAIEAVGGLTLGADPMVTAVALISHQEGNPIPAFIVRKEPKKHGTSAWIEGSKNLKRGVKVAILEDVVTTGGSTLRAIARAEEEGLKVVKVIALVDREEGGAENLKRSGYQLEAVFNRSDFL
ncbi:MAG: orotate phosphoribosyltransferase [Deltaproteobacteria bacterium]|nr:MAG: orotate phosphoribosyltransferase [Deltaproteobacteria bacterium]